MNPYSRSLAERVCDAVRGVPAVLCTVWPDNAPAPIAEVTTDHAGIPKVLIDDERPS